MRTRGGALRVEESLLTRACTLHSWLWLCHLEDPVRNILWEPVLTTAEDQDEMVTPTFRQLSPGKCERLLVEDVASFIIALLFLF